MNSRFPIAGARGVVEFSYGAELSGGYSPLSGPSEPGVSWSLSRVLDADLRFFKLALSSAANRSARLKFGVGGPCFLLPVFEFIWSTVPNHTISRNLAQSGPSGGRGQLRCGCPRYHTPVLRYASCYALAPQTALWQCPAASEALSSRSVTGVASLC